MDAGGQKTPEGACYKRCTYDGQAPGGDLFGDCTALRMVCGIRDFVDDYCIPRLDCNDDDDCGTGLRCVDSPSGKCALDCSVSESCPNSNLTCITSCPGTSRSYSLPACLPPDDADLCTNGS